MCFVLCRRRFSLYRSSWPKPLPIVPTVAALAYSILRGEQSVAKGKYEYWLSPDGLTLLGAWARDGLTDEEIAKKCGVSRSTLAEWKKRYPDISDTLKRGKDIVDSEVENALLKRALGYEYEEVMTEESEDGFKRRVTKKQVLPDVTAQIFWLKNRRPDKWRDKPETSPESNTDANMTALADLINCPQPNRNISDFEGDDE